MPPRQAIPPEFEFDLEKETAELNRELLRAQIAFEVQEQEEEWGMELEMISIPAVPVHRRTARRSAHPAQELEQLDWLGPLRETLAAGALGAARMARRVGQLLVLHVQALE
ncbi:hypothetical protein FJT64_005548 [Amphibalanus amphitrite]|uniref:Uncharacterized protein n=1 Tax=Amphibalanus amphitrite TaxID=1232801 RepID=A0A6A4VSF6_AMPAM|nr:hypothetical protein FJT64_005548 [Amphibalanus amphitrite]